MTALPESFADLLDAPGVASLATIGPDGRPQVTALWYLYDEGELKLSLNEVRQKTKNIVANPKVTLFLLDPANPFRTLEVRADAEWTYDDDRVLAGKVGEKYGADLQQMDQPGQRRLAITLKPTKVNANG